MEFINSFLLAIAAFFRFSDSSVTLQVENAKTVQEAKLDQNKQN